MTIKKYKDLLLKTAQTYLSEKEISKLKRCIAFAQKAHAGQKRRSNQPYFTHPLQVSLILVKLEQDIDTLCGALLHDTLEDCPITQEQLTHHFGKTIYTLVNGVTKLTAISFHSTQEEQAENYRKMLLAMTKDPRVMIIKLADRLHNMQTIKYLPQKNQAKMARETIEIFAPIARRLGIASIQWELEDLAFAITNPTEFQKIKTFISTKRSQRERHLKLSTNKIKTLLKKNQINSTIHGRAKHFYSIYKKCTKKNINYNELFDTLGIRIITKNIADCYTALGVLHTNFKPISDRFKDYIAVPKPNHYQSLHTAIIGPLGTPIECQIRTQSMHDIAEHGIASHQLYKQGIFNKKINRDFQWMGQVEDIESENKTPKAFLTELKEDLTQNDMFVFTPKGDIKLINEGCTVLDFAFKIHTQIGLICTGAKINDQIAPLHYVLKNGEQIDILTNKNQTPKNDWLNIVVTQKAKNKIKQWLKKQNRTSLIAKGKEQFNQWLKMHRLSVKHWLTNKIEKEICEKQQVKDINHLFLLIAQGELSSKQITKDILPKEELKSPLPRTVVQQTNKPQNNIHIFNQSTIMTRIAKCCSPIWGEKIQGIITKNQGISIHREDCKQLLRLEKQNPDWVVDAQWSNEQKNEKYEACLIIHAFDTLGLLHKISQLITENNINMIQIKSQTYDHNQKMMAMIRIMLNNREQLTQLMTQLNQLPDIIQIKRK